MANIKSAKKRIAVAEKKRAQNRAKESQIKTFVKKYKVAVEAGETELAVELFKKCTSLIDAAASDGIYHKNKADRLKAKYSKQLASVTAK